MSLSRDELNTKRGNMKTKVSSETKIENVVAEKAIIKTTNSVCNSCKSSLPSKLDKGICPFCGRKN